MKRHIVAVSACTLSILLALAPAAPGYVSDFIIPAAGGCPQPTRLNVAPGGIPVSRQWSISLPNPSTILTIAQPGTADQLNEIEGAILQSYGMWTGVSGTLVNSTSFPNALGPLARTSVQNACTNDQSSNTDGLNTICFNQSSAAFTTGVLAFTRLFIAEAPGATVGSSGPAAFAGQILDADILFRNDGQATFATPGALATPQGQGAYDLESLLGHELGHLFGLDHSGVWRAVMFPFAPPPGTFLGERPTASSPDAPLADDDRAGLRALYPDPSDTVDIGAISGRVLPANPFALAAFPPSSPGQFVTGIFGAQVVAVDAETGAVIAATLGGWSCDAANPPARFDGSFRIAPLPVGRSYWIYAEPFNGLVTAGDMSGAAAGLCSPSATPSCTVPAINTNFNPQLRPGP